MEKRLREVEQESTAHKQFNTLYDVIEHVSPELMRPEQWKLFKEVISFARRPAEEHNDLAHRQAWGRIRKLAFEAGAHLDDFLNPTPDRYIVAETKLFSYPVGYWNQQILPHHHWAGPASDSFRNWFADYKS